MGTEPTRYEFECPHCHERTIVEPSILTELVDNGCVFCEANLSKNDFKPVNRTT